MSSSRRVTVRVTSRTPRATTRRSSRATCSSRDRSGGLTCPAATGPRCCPRSKASSARIRRRRRSIPATWGSPRSGASAPPTRSCASSRSGEHSVIQAPRGTFDILPESAARRKALENQADKILGAAGYRRIETPTFEATELFARGVGESTDIVQKEMYTFDDGGGRSLTLRPEGTAPVCRAYLEHGMHKLPQPVKLWYLSSFFRAEAPQRGRYRQFWQVGAEVIGSATPEADAELILTLAELLQVLGVRETRLHLSSLGAPDTRAAYREELTAYLRAHEDGLSPEVVARIDLNPMRAFDASDGRTQETMRGAPTLLDRLAPADAEHFARVRELLDEQELRYELD